MDISCRADTPPVVLLSGVVFALSLIGQSGKRQRGQVVTVMDVQMDRQQHDCVFVQVWTSGATPAGKRLLPGITVTASGYSRARVHLCFPNPSMMREVTELQGVVGRSADPAISISTL